MSGHAGAPPCRQGSGRGSRRRGHIADGDAAHPVVDVVETAGEPPEASSGEICGPQAYAGSFNSTDRYHVAGPVTGACAAP